MCSFLSSFFSTKKKTSGHKNLHVDGDINGQPPPSSSNGDSQQSKTKHIEIRYDHETVDWKHDGGGQPPSPSSNGDSQQSKTKHNEIRYDHGTVDWKHDGGGQPPSVSGIRPVVVSQPSGGNQMSAADLPPSLNDVGRRGSSQNGDLVAGKVTMVDDEEKFAGMSLVGNKFKELFPVVGRKENDDDDDDKNE